MKRLLWLALIVWAAATALAQEDMSSYSGLLYHVSDYMAIDRDIMRAGPAYPKWPGYVRFSEDGRCRIEFETGITVQFTWERHGELDNVFILIDEWGTLSFLSYFPLAEIDVADVSHAVALVSFYPDRTRSRTYLFKPRE